MNKKYIDISYYQKTSALNFEKLKDDGIEGVIIRAGYGRFGYQKDKCFESHYAAIKKAGLPVGCYHYTYMKDKKTAKEEAATLLEWIYDKEFELPVYCDIEDKTLETLGKEKNTNNVITFCETLENAGYFAGVYANSNWFRNFLERERLKRFTQWEANYSKEPKSGADIWQYTDKARFDGFSGNLDANICYRDDFTEIIKRLGLNGFDKTSEQNDNDLPGDVNGDGIINAADARMILRASAGLLELTDAEFKRADINGDGEITAAEARAVLRLAAELDTQSNPKKTQ